MYAYVYPNLLDLNVYFSSLDFTYGFVLHLVSSDRHSREAKSETGDAAAMPLTIRLLILNVRLFCTDLHAQIADPVESSKSPF